MKLNRNSWVYKLARFGGMRDRYHYHTDICSLFWGCVWGVLMPVILTAMALAGLAVVFGLAYIFGVMPLVMAIAWLNGYSVEDPFQLGMGGFIWGISVGLAWALLRDESKPVALVELVGAGYRRWKDKTCTLIELEG